MSNTNYLRALSKKLRGIADAEPNPDTKRELAMLADRCEQLANSMSGNGAGSHEEQHDHAETRRW